MDAHCCSSTDHCHRLLPWACVILVITATSVLGLPEPAAAESKWWQEVRKIEADQLAGRWKRSLKRSTKVAEEARGRSWRDPEMAAVLARLAMHRAIADANLGDDERAVWYWHMAQNLDSRVRTKDLAPFGRAAALLYENLLRQRGELPARVDEVLRPPFRSGFQQPRNRPNARFNIVLPTAAMRAHWGIKQIELLVDASGRLSDPVVLDTAMSHPTVTYGVLEAMWHTMPIEPARQDGRPAAVLFIFQADVSLLSW